MAKGLCYLSAGDPLFTEQLPDTEPKVWLPCVLKKMMSPLKGQAYNNGSFGWELLWLKWQILMGEKWTYITCLISRTQKTAFEMHRLTTCLVLISVSVENTTLKEVVSPDQVDIFHPAILSFLPFSFWGYIFLLSWWFILPHGIQYCFTELFLCM